MKLQRMCMCAYAVLRYLQNVPCVVCHVRVLYQISFYHSVLFSCFILHTHKHGFIKHTDTCMHACKWTMKKKRELSRMQFYSVCSGVGVHVYGNVYRYDNYECEQFWYDGAMHMTFTRDDGRKYGDPFPLSSAELFTQLKKAMCTVLRQHKQIPLNIKLFLVIWLCETRILSTKIWRSVQSKLKTTFCASFPTIRWISF